MREHPHESVRRHAETTLVERDEAHDIPFAWPWLPLGQRSNPLRPVGVGDRTKKAVVDERLQHLHGHVGRLPRIRREDDRRTAGHWVMENEGYGGKSLSLLSLSLAPSSPFFSPALSVLGNGSKAEKASTGKVRRGWSRLVSYLCRERTK